MMTSMSPECIRSLAMTFATASALAGLVSACGSPPECNDIFIFPAVTGSYAAATVPFTSANDLLVCYGSKCGAELEGQFSITIDRSPGNGTFVQDAGAPVTPDPSTIKLTYTVPTRGVKQCQSGDILRIRYPNRAEGPWSVDLRFVAKVETETECTPCHGTFAPAP